MRLIWAYVRLFWLALGEPGGVWRNWCARLDGFELGREAETAALVALAEDDPAIHQGDWNASAVPPARHPRPAEWIPVPPRIIAREMRPYIAPDRGTSFAPPEHVGATPDWSPTDELRQLVHGEFTATGLLPQRVVQAEVKVPDADALADDVSAAFEGWDALFAEGFARLDEIIAAALKGTAGAYDRAWAVRERTQAMPTIRRELVAA